MEHYKTHFECYVKKSINIPDGTLGQKHLWSLVEADLRLLGQLK